MNTDWANLVSLNSGSTQFDGRLRVREVGVGMEKHRTLHTFELP